MDALGIPRQHAAQACEKLRKRVADMLERVCQDFQQRLLTKISSCTPENAAQTVGRAVADEILAFHSGLAQQHDTVLTLCAADLMLR